MYTILCFGDSNIWGYDSENETRYSLESTWPYVMKNNLNESCQIIVEALNGRTTGSDDPSWPDRNGMKQLPICLESHEPIDLVIIMLGSNDLKFRFKLSSKAIAANIEALIQICQKSKFSGSKEDRRILLVAPPPIIKEDGFPNDEFKNGVKKSQELANEYKKIAEKLKCDFFDAAGIVSLSNKDGIHFTKSDHNKFGNEIVKVIRNTFKR